MTPDELAAIHAAAFTQSRPWSADEFAALLQQPTTILGQATGSFALLRAVAGEAEVLTVATHPDHRRNGHARAALLQAEAQAIGRDVDAVFLDVAEDNTAAIALYAALGYERVGVRKHYYARKTGNAVNAVLMRKSLAKS